MINLKTKKILIVILAGFVLGISDVFAQTDTIDTKQNKSQDKKKISIAKDNTWKSNFGISSLFFVGMQVTNFNLQDNETLTDYHFYYGTLTPGFSFFLITGKNNLFFKNELALTKIHTKESYKITWQDGIKKYIYNIRTAEYRYKSITYNLGFGFLLESRFLIIPGAQINYIFFKERYLLEGYNGYINQLIIGDPQELHVPKKYFWGVNLEMDFKLSDRWLIGIKASKQIDNIPYYGDKHYLSYFQFSVTRFFVKKK